MKAQFNLIQSLLFGEGGALASALFALLAIPVSENASADPNSATVGISAGFHCGANGHPLDGNTTCTGENAILLDRNSPRAGLTCGACVPLVSLTASGAYSSDNFTDPERGGLFVLRGQNYFNSDRIVPGNGALRRFNGAFCEDWFGATYDSSDRTCSCPDGEMPIGNHGVCVACNTEVPANILPHVTNIGNCPDGEFSFGDGASSATCGTFQQCVGGELGNFTQFSGNPWSMLLTCSCETNWDLLSCDSAGCYESLNCGGGAVDQNRECVCPGANQVYMNDRCECEEGYGDGAASGLNCVQFPVYNGCDRGEINVGSDTASNLNCVPNCSVEPYTSNPLTEINLTEAIIRQALMDGDLGTVPPTSEAIEEEVNRRLMSTNRGERCIPQFSCLDPYGGVVDPTGELCIVPSSVCNPPNDVPEGCLCEDPNGINEGETECKAECNPEGGITMDCFCPSSNNASRFYRNPDNGSCAIRVSCSQFHEFEANVCVPRASRDCPDHQQFVEAPNNQPGGTCRDRVARDCPDDYEFSPSENSGPGGTCTRCETGEFSSEGAECTASVTECTAPHTRRVGNECVECDENQHLVNGACVACDPNEVRAQGVAACTCMVFTETDGSCVPFAQCTGDNVIRNAETNDCICADDSEGTPETACTACAGEYVSTGGAACACPRDESFDAGEGVCEVNLEGTCGHLTYASETNTCSCPDGQTENADQTACEDIVTCTSPLTPNAENECHCPPDTHFGDIASCVPHTHCPAESEDRNPETNTCRCADDFEGEAGSCMACEGGKQSRNGAASCACPTDLSFDRNGVCEASLDGTCTEPRTLYNSATNACDCPAGQRLNADGSACEAIPASSGGGSSSGGAAALIAVPVVLIAGYWWLGGFEYLSPAYGLDYSGENGDLDWRGNAGFNLRHGGLHSYASAIQSNGNAVSYESGISYERDFISLTYDAAESESEYLYDFGASAKAEFGLWTIAPTASSEFQYRQEVEEWTSSSSAGLSAAWTSHKWKVKAQSAFAGDGAGHTMDLELRF